MPVMPGTHFSIDFIGLLPPSQWNGIWYDSIFVYKDCFNGWIEAWPTTTNATGEDIADLYFTHIFPQTGLPESIIQILRNWTSMKQDNWAQHLPLVAYAINISTNDRTKISPFYLRHSHQP